MNLSGFRVAAYDPETVVLECWAESCLADAGFRDGRSAGTHIATWCDEIGEEPSEHRAPYGSATRGWATLTELLEHASRHAATHPRPELAP